MGNAAPSDKRPLSPVEALAGENPTQLMAQLRAFWPQVQEALKAGHTLRHCRAKCRRGVSFETQSGSSPDPDHPIRNADRPVRGGRISRPLFDPDVLSILRRESYPAEVEGLPVGPGQAGCCRAVAQAAGSGPEDTIQHSEPHAHHV